MRLYRPQVNRPTETRSKGITYRMTPTEYNEIKKYIDSKGLSWGMFFELAIVKFFENERKRK